ncbi:type VII secretion system-associated protein [Lentzea sp. NPDC004782]|uniref:type VII secretion system-associated protein n=1 Tax=Lentzea sp. NPDC004782 TaxID=3154458 RepID=UPI0033B0DD11
MTEAATWCLLVDHSFAAVEVGEVPPTEALLGAWPLSPDGGLGRFEVNTGYRPDRPGSSSDSVDAGVWLLLHRDAEPEQLQLLLRDSTFDIAMNGDGLPLIVKSPDDVPCAIVATAEVHRRRISSPDWLRADVEDLVALLADGVDVLFNPGGDTCVRLLGDFVREVLSMDDEDIAVACRGFLDQGVGLLIEGSAAAGMPGGSPPPC